MSFLKQALFTMMGLTLGLLGFANAYAEEGGFGRLFTTPTQRAELNYLRQSTKFNINRKDAELESPVTQEPIPLSERVDALAFQGYVKRSDGKKGTVWINQTALSEDEVRDGIAVGRIGNAHQIQIKGEGIEKPLLLKPGQRYLSNQDRVVEESEVDHISVHTGK